MATTTAQRRLATPAVLLVGGGAIAVGAWVGGEHWLALALAGFFVAAGIVAYVWAGGDSDTAALLRVDGDERQKLLDLRATAFSALAMIVFCLAGSAIDLAQGGTGNPWALICGVGGVGYIVGLVVIHRRS